MIVLVHEINSPDTTKIDLPAVPRVGDSIKIPPDGERVIAGSTTWESGEPPVVSYRRIEQQ